MNKGQAAWANVGLLIGCAPCLQELKAAEGTPSVKINIPMTGAA